MRIECESCKALYNIDDALLSDQPIGAQCPYCSHVKVVSRADFGAKLPEAGGEIAAPGSYGGGGISLPPPGPAPGSGIAMAGFEPMNGFEPTPMAPPPAFEPGGQSDYGGDRFGNSETEPDGASCQVCGTPLSDEFDKVLGLCETHQRERAGHRAPSTSGEAKEWRVRLGSGEVVGPFSLGEVREQIQGGLLGDGDEFARSDDVEFKPSSEYMELRVFNAAGAGALGSVGLPSAIAKPKVKPRRAGPNIGMGAVFIVLLLLIAGGAGAFYASDPVRAMAFVDKLTKGGGGPLLSESNPLSRQVPEWKHSQSNVSGSPEEHIHAAEQKYFEDRWKSYEEARTSLRRALILDPNNVVAAAEYIENEIVWHGAYLSPEELGLLKATSVWALGEGAEQAAVHRAKAALDLFAGELNGARAAAESALERDATDGRAKLLLAETYVTGNYDLAIVEAEAAGTMLPALRRVDRVLARSYANGGRYSSAIKVLDGRLAKDRDSAATYTLYGDILRDLGKSAAAQGRYRAAMSAIGDRLLAELQLADLMFERASFEVAAGLYKRVADRESAPTSYRVRALGAWSRVELQRRQWRRAMSLAEAGLELEPRDAAALLTKAEVSLETGSATTAVDFAEKTLQVRGGEPAALVVLGRIAINEGKMAEGIKYLEEAAQNDARDPRLKALLAAAYLKFNSAVQAFTVLRRAAEIDPMERDARNRKDVIGLSTSPIAEAVSRFNEASKQDRNRSLAFSAIGMLEYHSGDLAGAREAFTRALRADEGNSVALLYDAQIAWERGATKRALKAAARLLRVEKGSVMGNLMMGRILAAQGNDNDARDHLDSANRGRKGFTPAEVELAALELSKDKAGALRALKAAHRVNPYSLRTRSLLLASGY